MTDTINPPASGADAQHQPKTADGKAQGQEFDPGFWYVPPDGNRYQKQHEWHTPAKSATTEQLEAFRTLPGFGVPTRSPDLPEDEPERSGAWYRPPYAVNLEPAPIQEALDQAFTDSYQQDEISVDEFLDQDQFEAMLDNVINRDIEDQEMEVALDELIDKALEEAEHFRDVPSVEDIEARFREAPEGIDGKAFRDVPDVPLSAQLQSNFGGLRDEEAAAAAAAAQAEEEELKEQALSLDEVGREASGQPIEVPGRGLGGMMDRAISSEDALSRETGEIAQPEVSSSHTPPPSDTGNFQAQPAPQMAAQPNQRETGDIPLAQPKPDKFKEVEEAVEGLRGQFRRGQMSRAQLESELRNHMVLDEYGRWWTLGVDSNRWYRYDGREWIQDEPPRPVQPAAQQGQLVKGSYVPTETNVQPPAGSAEQPGVLGVRAQAPQDIEVDEYGMPLPQLVPEDDPGATVVNLRAATPQDERSAETLPSIQSPLGADETLQGDPERTQVNVQAADATVVGPSAGAPAIEEENYVGVPAVEEAKKEKEPLQPDYSEAFQHPLSRSQLLKYGIWTGVSGIVLVLGVTLCFLLGSVAYYFVIVGRYEEDINNLDELTAQFEDTLIYDANGNLLATYSDPQRGERRYVGLEEISPYVIHATVATEDETYYENPGFSVFGIMRAVYTNTLGDGPRSGASTITQQLVREVIFADEEFSTEEGRKVDEIIVAAELSRTYTKNEILELYLNQFDYGNRAIGIEAAAQTYFQKPAAELDPYEAAFLAGLPQAPGIYDPMVNREASLGRMQTVLRLMTEANGDGCIQMEHQFTGQVPMDYVTDEMIMSGHSISGGVSNFNLTEPLCITEDFLANTEVGKATTEIHIGSLNITEVEPRYAHFVQWVFDQVVEEYGEEYVFSTGLNVYTTIRPEIQEAAQQVIVNQVNTTPPNNGAAVVIDPQSGAVLAMVGSADFGSDEIDGQVNILFSPQQPGSTIKPLVYLTALQADEEGNYWTPATVVWDTPVNYNGYEPTNFPVGSNNFSGPLPARNALARSLNVPAVKTLAHVGFDAFENTAATMGVSFPLQEPSEAGLPSAVGAAEIVPIELVSAYATLANGGRQVNPYGIQRVEDRDGNIIQEPVSNNLGPQVIQPELAYLMNYMLSSTEARLPSFPRGSTLEIPGYTVAAKTGTSGVADVRDAWTIGWTPNFITGVWFGNTRNEGFTGGTGYSIAAPAWNQIMRTALANTEPVQFARPASIENILVCIDSGTQVPEEGCGPGGNEFFDVWSQQPPPSGDESFIQTVNVDPFTNLRANQYCPQNNEQATFLLTDDPSAIEWLNNNPQGQSWAAERGIDLPLSLPPEGECPPDYVQPFVSINFPTPNALVRGITDILGTIQMPNFDRYEIQILSADGSQVVENLAVPGNTLPENPDSRIGAWTTNNVANGNYLIRVTAYSQTGASLSEDVPVTVDNANITTEESPPPSDNVEDEQQPGEDTPPADTGPEGSG